MQISQLTYQKFHLDGNITDQDFYIFRPITQYGFFGDLFCLDPSEVDGISCVVTTSLVQSKLFQKPISYEPVFDMNEFKSNTKVTFYKAIPPPGFISLSLVAAQSVYDIPDNYFCISQDFINFEQENIEITIFNPYGKYTTLLKSFQHHFNIDSKVPSINEVVLEDISQLQDFQDIGSIVSLIKLVDGEELSLPLLSITQKKEYLEIIEPQDDDNDNMRNIKCRVAQSGIGIQLSTHKCLQFEESHLFAPAISYNLVGITSLTPPAQSQKEDYLFILQPVAPPGYESLSLILSNDIYPQHEYVTVSKKLLMYTSHCDQVGKMYDINTASYIYDYQQIDVDDSLDCLEKTRKYNELGQIDLKTIQLVTPRQSYGAVLLERESGYPIIHPLVMVMLNINTAVSQKSLVKGIRQEKQLQLSTKVDIQSVELSFFQQELKKDSYQQIFNIYSHKEIDQFDFSKQYNQPKQEPRAKTPNRNTEVEKNDQLKVQCIDNQIPQDIPIEWSFISNGHAFDSGAISEPQAFEIVYQSGIGKNRTQFIKLIAPYGFASLSDVVHHGDTPFDKSKYACINSSFVNQIRVKRFLNLNEDWSIVQPILPYGTQQCQLSQLKVFYLMNNITSFTDMYISILKDNVFQAHITQEGLATQLIYSGKSVKFDKSIIEQRVINKNILEVQVQSGSLLNKFKFSNVIDQEFSQFHTYISEYDPKKQELDLPDGQIENPDQQEPEIQQEQILGSMSKILVATKFSGQFSINGMFAKAKRLQLKGCINQDQKIYCYNIICEQDYISLGSIISDIENPSLDNIITVHKSFVKYEIITNPEYSLSGYFDTEGLWVYTQNETLFVFDFPFKQIKLPKLVPEFSLLTAKQSKLAIYPADDLYAITNPLYFYSYLTSFSHNNKISLSSLHIHDFGINAFDQSIVNDQSCKNSLLYSISSIRFISSTQVLTKSLFLQSIKPEQLQQYQNSAEKMYVKKAKILLQILKILRSLNYGLDFIFIGKKAQLAFKINNKFVIISDKIPIFETGGFFLGEDVQIQFCLSEKVLAKLAGSYFHLYSLDTFQLINFVLSVYGFSNSHSKHVFDIFVTGDQISTFDAEGSVKISVKIE
ncbi:hypothetical protein SS50377_20099 [Spironucleus salmonicida]|uniref:Uncharacterized protein n=1 Tax=Spironucleus salmonicida TaxID=348837 RepID=V6LN78_9EUKA|nr:hypothetical protein SS50377_20099 [Spironucleus salmonicida]|eukprot:EST45156.1 hypothetical protein SS50377_14728 [Spironucleus salmonicida]